MLCLLLARQSIAIATEFQPDDGTSVVTTGKLFKPAPDLQATSQDTKTFVLKGWRGFHPSDGVASAISRRS
jgi:hypothetical protein